MKAKSIGLSTIFHKTNKKHLSFFLPFFNFKNFQHIISAILLNVKAKEVFSSRKDLSESLWATLILKWHRKYFFVLFYYFLFVFLIPSSVWKTKSDVKHRNLLSWPYTRTIIPVLKGLMNTFTPSISYYY